MNRVRELHDEAMSLAEQASGAKIRGDTTTASGLFNQAYLKESEAARLLQNELSAEPTRSILFRSAASLALECGEPREAERLIATGLSGNPPEDISEELRDLLEQVNFERHLKLRGVQLESEEVQMSIAGKSTGFGIAPSEQLVTRIEDARRMVIRTVERLLGKPYRESGAIGADIREYGLMVSIPRAASFAVTLRVSHPTRPLPGFEDQFEVDRSVETVDEIMSCLELFNKSDEPALRQRIGQDNYYRNFVAIAKNLAPDGNDIRQVGFTSTGDGRERRVSLRIPRDHIKLASPGSEETVAEGKRETTIVFGRLLFADARKSRRQRIQLIDDQSRPHDVIVPEGLMSDIVKPLWDERVRVTGFLQGRAISMEDIARAPDDQQ